MPVSANRIASSIVHRKKRERWEQNPTMIASHVSAWTLVGTGPRRPGNEAVVGRCPIESSSVIRFVSTREPVGHVVLMR